MRDARRIGDFLEAGHEGSYGHSEALSHIFTA
jgi:hypothetical protein